jgi:hypothetical protein
MFDVDKDGGLSLWEMNSLLLAIGSATLADQVEYDRLVNGNDFLITSEGFLTKAGLTAYYEKFGRLSEDILALGLGSVDDVVSGSFDVSVSYDPEALRTATPLLEKQTLNMRYFKSLLARFCASKEFTWDSQIDKISDIFELFKDTGLYYYAGVLIGGPSTLEFLKSACSLPGMSFKHML